MTKISACGKIKVHINKRARIINEYTNYINSFNTNKLDTPLTEISSLSGENDKFSSLSTSALLARVGVPTSHILVADNYMFIKKIYGTPVVKSRISNKEKALLGKYDFNQLEYTTIKQINEELELLKKWSMSLDESLKADADKIVEVRAKELKYLAASRYTLITNEIYNGYMALEKYFEDITKYSI